VLFTPSDRRRSDLDVGLFADCNARELRRIEGLSTGISREGGRVLCREGEIGRECFVLLDGVVAVETNDRHFTVGRGAPIGEIALLIPNGRRTATVTALSDVEALVFTRAEFTQLMTGIPTVAHKILHEATRRLVENGAAN